MTRVSCDVRLRLYPPQDHCYVQPLTLKTTRGSIFWVPDMEYSKSIGTRLDTFKWTTVDFGLPNISSRKHLEYFCILIVL